MPLFEVETEAHVIIAWAEDESAAQAIVKTTYPRESALCVARRPRDTWVISKAALGIKDKAGQDPCTTARDCLAKAAGDKLHAIRIYMQETGTDLEHARKVIESNMIMGW